MSHQQTKRSRSSASRRQEPRIPAWVWLFTGAILGAFVMFLMRLADIKDQPQTQVKNTPVAETDAPSESSPKFDFYELLKNNNISVPEFGGDSQTDSIQSAPEYDYLLQVASFKSKKDAEALKIKLLLLNLEASLEKAKIESGGTWHRVIVGPFESRSLLAKARSTLISNNYSALLLKRPKDG